MTDTDTPDTRPSEPETPDTRPSEPETPDTRPSEPETPPDWQRGEPIWQEPRPLHEPSPQPPQQPQSPPTESAGGEGD